MERHEKVVDYRRVEIDTSQPFKSVKEAVALFGERVLVGEIYANKLKEMQKASEQEQRQSRFELVSEELEETKHTLQTAREEGCFLAHCLVSLKQELQETKRELRKLKTRDSIHYQSVDLEIEDLKFVENPSRKVDGPMHFQKRRSVKFASPPAFVINSKDIREIPLDTNQQNKSEKKMKKKALIRFFGGLFSRNMGAEKH